MGSSPRLYYSVWRNSDDSIVCLDATWREAARAMGIKNVDSFFSTVCRCRKGQTKKWHIETRRIRE